jgi:peptidoglycan/xylan/chitin deacetylase (PgdA/CDA1 family)
MARGQLEAVPRSLNLTFDDGPDRVWTRRMTAALRRHDVRGTFFMVGERVLAEPIVACEVLEQGHQIQLHCHRHVRHTELSGSEIERDTWDALAALAEIGVEPTRWRTPWGVVTADSEAVAARLGLRLIGWDHDTHDWRGDSPARMMAALGPRLSLGGSVLMHDGLGPGATRSDCSNTVGLLDPLIEAARTARLLVSTARDLDDAAGQDCPDVHATALAVGETPS